LPRGLGDDPLSRPKKNGTIRFAASDSLLLNSVVTSHDSLPVQSFVREEMTIEAQHSPSYNDVFFHRRSESNLVLTTTENEEASSPSSSEPEIQPNIANEIGVSVETVQAGFVQSQAEGDTGPAEAQPSHDETPIVANESAKTSQPKTEERGLFKRIFGRLGQKKSH